MSAPILHPGDRIHLVVPVTMSDQNAQQTIEEYKDHGVSVVLVTHIGQAVQVAAVFRDAQPDTRAE